MGLDYHVLRDIPAAVESAIACASFSILVDFSHLKSIESSLYYLDTIAIFSGLDYQWNQLNCLGYGDGRKISYPFRASTMSIRPRYSGLYNTEGSARRKKGGPSRPPMRRRPAPLSRGDEVRERP